MALGFDGGGWCAVILRKQALQSDGFVSLCNLDPVRSFLKSQP
jgi:hypothetical protein